MIEHWISRAERASTELPNGKRLFQAYAALLKFVWYNDYIGACHDTSAILYIILSEMGFSPVLMIGEVKAAIGIFDHSWVELDGKVYDVAVGFPGEDGCHVGPSIFASLNLHTGEPTDLEFGVRSQNGLDEVGRMVANSNLDQYSKLQPEGKTIWDFASMIGAACGLKIRKAHLKIKYGKIVRTLVESGAR